LASSVQWAGRETCPNRAGSRGAAAPSNRLPPHFDIPTVRRVPRGYSANSPEDNVSGLSARFDTAERSDATMASATETGNITGTQDKDYNLLWYVESCLENALRLDTFIKDAERAKDTQLVELFTKAQADSRKGAELGKSLLRSRLTSD
jgi:hypothetical protein